MNKHGKIIFYLLLILLLVPLLAGGALFVYSRVAEYPWCWVDAWPPISSPNGQYMVRRLDVTQFIVNAECQDNDSDLLEIWRKGRPAKDVVYADSDGFDTNYFRPLDNPIWVSNSILRYRTQREAKHLMHGDVILDYAADDSGKLDVINERDQSIDYVFIDTHSDFLILFDMQPHERRKTTFRMTTPAEFIRCRLHEAQLTNEESRDGSTAGFTTERNTPAKGDFKIRIKPDGLEITSSNYRKDS